MINAGQGDLSPATYSPGDSARAADHNTTEDVRRAPRTGTVSEWTSARHIPALDGVRGLAVLMVLCYDCLKIPTGGSIISLLSRKLASVGWVGVDLFFVLSGFLITGILLDTVGRQGYWKSFLLRRSLRIFPLYYFTLLLVFVLAPLLARVLDWGRLGELLHAVREDQFWYVIYAQNWLFAWRGTWPDERVLNHFWSLAVEEQFYLFWPLVIVFLRGRRLAVFCLGLCLLAVSLRLTLWQAGWPPVVPFVMTICRLDSLCAGALLAVGIRSDAWRTRWLPWAAWCCLGSVLLLFALDVPWNILRSETWASGTLGHACLAFSFAALIAMLLTLPERHLVSRGFSQPGLILLGKYSYAIYVFHRMIYYGVLEWSGLWQWLPIAWQPWGIFLATLLLSLLAARVSWLLIEGPCLALKKYAPRPQATVPEHPALESTPHPARTAQEISPAIPPRRLDLVPFDQ